MRRVTIEISIVDDEVHPDIFIVQREEIFDAQGNSVGIGKNHRAPFNIDDNPDQKNIDEQLADEPMLHLTDKEEVAIKGQIDGIKATLPMQARPTPEVVVPGTADRPPALNA